MKVKETVIVMAADSCFDVEPTSEILDLHAILCKEFGNWYRFKVERYGIHNWRIVGEFDSDNDSHWHRVHITMYARGYLAGRRVESRSAAERN